jgi:peptidoglycan/LPS O-acetylase OafA/YrhL
MNIWPVIKAPIAVQLNRIAFAIYTIFFGSYLWRVHRFASVEGTAIFLGMIFLSVLGLFYSCIRARRARWVMAVLVVLIPGLVITAMCLMEFSRPDGWLDWLMAGVFVFVGWLGVPILLALSLFTNISIASGKKSLALEFKISRESIAYFTGADPGGNAASEIAPLPGK